MRSPRALRLLVPSSLIAASFAAESSAAPSVWAIDDGEKIKRDAVTLPFESGTDNPVWQPGKPIRLFSLRNETVAIQIVVEADGTPLDKVTVDLGSLTSPSGGKIENAAGATDPTKYVGRFIERFVVHYFDVKRESSTKGTTESLGWAPGSGPAKGKWIGWMPDALIPVEVAPPWSPYPLQIAANQNGVMWIDITIPKDQPPGTYGGNVVVKAGTTALSTIAIELDVLGATLPDRPVKTMMFYDTDDLKRVGGVDPAEKQLWQLYHRHRLSPMHGASSVADVDAHLAGLDGSLYTAPNGYDGPGVGQGDGILSLGTYGAFGAPDATTLGTVEKIADALAAKDLFPSTDVFVYAIDETCSSPYGASWKSLISGSSNANVKKVKVGWTCSTDPSASPVDVPIVFAGSFDLKTAAAARAKGKDVWIYNGYMPSTGSFLTDSAAISLRVNGWIAGLYDIGRWFYWETAFWYDGNSGGKGPYDPYVTSETFHNSDGDQCQGDGVLTYPGKQVDLFTTHSIGIGGVLSSVRLKNFRRGIEDAGYYQLAHAVDPAKAEAIAKALLVKVLADAKHGEPTAFPELGKPYYDARKALADIIPKSAPIDPDGGIGDGGGDAAPIGDATGTPGDGAPTAIGDDGGASGCGCRLDRNPPSPSSWPSPISRAQWPVAGTLGTLVFVRRRRRAQ